jgi:hypothetical protein
MSAKKPPETVSNKGGREGDLFRAILRAPNREKVSEVLRKKNLDVGSMRSPRGAREVEVVLFVTQKQAEELKQEGWQIEVFENLSEIGRSRQQEVGKGDRFEGGKIPPKGLGKKTRKE